ncbi:MAG TPA: hypothetical protein ENK12_06730 [Gammaproteobacteria bacterium]|nr:hypothetical protein [Gammaproteobacteria bacterium]
MPERTLKITGSRRLLAGLALLCLALPGARAAEVRGRVEIDHTGLFGVDASVRQFPVSVALIPAAGQRVRRGRPKTRRIEIRDNRLWPAFMTVRKGDRVVFVNRDPVFHEIFSLSTGKALEARLDKAGASSQSSHRFRLKQPGVTHFFCRIHNKSYARIDVVDTPYIKMVEPGKPFEFTGIAPGTWTLRLASPAAETRRVKVNAVTSPPRMTLRLVSRGGGNGPSDGMQQSRVEGLFQ